MSSIPPPTSPLRSEQSSPSQGSKMPESPQIEAQIAQVAGENLEAPQVESKPNSYWSWSYWWSGKKEQPSTTVDHEEKGNEEEELWEQAEGEISSKNPHFDDQEISKQEKLFTDTAKKTETAKDSWWNSVMSVVPESVQLKAHSLVKESLELATKKIQTYAEKYNKQIDKNKQLADLKQEMLTYQKESEFVEFYEFAKVLMTSTVKTKLQEAFKEDKDSFIARNLLSQENLIVDLLEINLAKGFVHLAKQVHASQDVIPHYEKQPFLVNILSFLSKKADKQFDSKRLQEIENKYQQARKDFFTSTKQLFPDLTEFEREEICKKYIQNQAYTDKQLDQYDYPTQQMILSLKNLHLRHQELHEFFSEAADALLINLFPNKFSDMEIPSFLQIGGSWGIAEFLYQHFVKESIVNVLQDSYESIKDDSLRTKKWKADLEARVGTVNIEPVIQAPADFLGAFLKDYIQTNPNAVALTTQFLSSLTHPKNDSDSLEDETQARERLLAQMSQDKLAAWIMESTQSILLTEDLHLLKIGDFIQRGIQQLTLALLAKGASIVIPEGEKIKEKEFIKELSDRIVAKFNSFQGQDVPSNQFWIDFVKDLPLPPMMKEQVALVLIEKTENLKTKWEEANPELQVIQKIYQETEKTIQGYQNGAEILTIIEKLSDQLIEKVLEQNIGLVSTLGMEETIDELFAFYLPHVKINEELKNWFKENIHALGVSEKGQSPQSIFLLKQAIQAVLRKAFVNTIEITFKNNSKDYAAQLLANIQLALAKATAGIDQAKRLELDKALILRKEIREAKTQIEELKKPLLAKPKGLNPSQTLLLEEVVKAYRNYLQTRDSLKGLEGKQQEIFERLNENYADKIWTVEELSLVNEAFKLKETQFASFDDPQLLVDELSNQIATLEAAGESEESLAPYEMLRELFKMSAPELQFVSEAMNIEATIQRTHEKIQELKTDLEIKKGVVNQHPLDQVPNQSDWIEAKKWLKEVLKNYQNMDRLSKKVNESTKELHSYLENFQILAQELTALMGLDQKDQLELPTFAQDVIWPIIQNFRDESLTLLLFDQFSPLLLSTLDIQKNKAKLDQFADKHFRAPLAHHTSMQIVNSLPELISSYQPFAEQILTIIGINPPDAKEITQMEVSLVHKMFELGKENITASMLDPLLEGLVPKDKRQKISQALARMIKSTKQEFSKDEILDLLKKEVNPAPNQKEEKQLEEQAQVLAKSTNRFLINRGRAKLKTEDFLEVYENQRSGTQVAVQVDKKDAILQQLKSEKIIEKIKEVLMTPEEIANLLNDWIPGASGLHTLIGSQLEEILTGKDQVFIDTRAYIQQYIEGVLLNLLVKIPESQGQKNQNILAVLTHKLQNSAVNAKEFKGKSDGQVAHQMIDEALKQVLGIASADDIEGIPFALQKVCYEKLKEQAYLQLTPLILPIIERTRNRAELKKLSGSGYLGSLASVLSKDIFTLLPSKVKSYQSISKEIFTLLSGGKSPSDIELDLLTQEVITLVNNVNKKNVSHSALLKAYMKVANLNLQPAQQVELKEKLDAHQIKEKIQGIFITPEQIGSLIGESLPVINPQLQQDFAAGLEGLLHDEPEIYQNLSNFGSTYIESIVLKFLINHVAKKNPADKTKGQDTILVLAEKLFDIIAQKYPEIKNRPFNDVVAEFSDSFMKDVLGIDSPAHLEGVPEPLKVLVYDAIKDQLMGILIRFQQGLLTLESGSEVKKAQTNAKRFGVNAADEANLQIFVNMLSHLVMNSTLDYLTEIGEGKKGAKAASRGLEMYFEELVKENINVAQMGLNYTKGAQFKDLLRTKLAQVVDPNNLVEDKQKIEHLLSQMMLVPFDQLLNQVFDFTDTHGAQFNQKLATNIFDIATKEIRIRREAEKIASDEGRSQISHKDFVKTAGADLHPAVPKTSVRYDATIKAISQHLYGLLSPANQKKSGKVFEYLTPSQAQKWLELQEPLREKIADMVKQEQKNIKNIEDQDLIAEIEKIHHQVMGFDAPLTDKELKALKNLNGHGLSLKQLIRQEAEAPDLQRKKEAYGPAIKAVMKLMFPNGKSDLTFVSEKDRDIVWKLFRKNLFPLILPLLTELILDPNVIEGMILGGLESARDSLLPLHERPSDRLLAMYQKGDLVLKSGQAAHEVFENLSIEEIRRRIKQGQLMEKEVPLEPENRPIDALDIASGAFVSEILKTVKLPKWVKKQMVDPSTGELNLAMQKKLGATLRQQFSDHFIKDNLQTALEKLVQIDENGNYLLKPGPAAKTEEELKLKAAATQEKRKKMAADLKKVSREVVDASISSFIHQTWEGSQRYFDRLIDKVLPFIGLRLKHALDAVFRFVFFKIIGTFLSILFSPIKGWVKEKVYHLISLDENREIILKLLTQTPSDQPETEGHAVYNENLVYKLGAALKKTVDEMLNAPIPPILPVSDEILAEEEV